jgi:membrane associated rhomboid family serine protease
MKEDLKRIFSQSNIVGKYVLVMVALFLVLRILMFLGFHPDEWLALPQQPGKLLTRPWTILTYMFTHVDTRHVFWNMVLLWSGGMIFCEILGERRFVKAYWLGGLLGGLFFLIAYNVDPELKLGFTYLLGASASVLSVLVAVTMHSPNYMVRLPLLGQFKLLYVTLVFLVLTLPLGFSNFGGDVAHLGGIAWGLFYGWQLKQNKEPLQWFDNLAFSIPIWINSILDSFSANRRKKAKMKVYTQAGSIHVPRDDKEYNAMKKAKAEQIDRILEKISKSGYESLNAQEKAILFNASNSEKDA